MAEMDILCQYVGVGYAKWNAIYLDIHTHGGESII